jgi:hypothetical protein
MPWPVTKQNFFRNIWLKYHATSYLQFDRIMGRGWVCVGSGLVRRGALGAGVRRGRGAFVRGRGRGRVGWGGAFVFSAVFLEGHSTYGVNSSI